MWHVAWHVSCGMCHVACACGMLHLQVTRTSGTRSCIGSAARTLAPERGLGFPTRLCDRTMPSGPRLPTTVVRKEWRRCPRGSPKMPSCLHQGELAARCRCVCAHVEVQILVLLRDIVYICTDNPCLPPHAHRACTPPNTSPPSIRCQLDL
jgi:hypothetical protein